MSMKIERVSLREGINSRDDRMIDFESDQHTAEDMSLMKPFVQFECSLVLDSLLDRDRVLLCLLQRRGIGDVKYDGLTRG